jgi:hypothetical protein
VLNAYRKDDGLPTLPPRWPHGEPVLVELEVPRVWCLWRRGVGGLRAGLEAAWEARKPAFMLGRPGEALRRPGGHAGRHNGQL